MIALVLGAAGLGAFGISGAGRLFISAGDFNAEGSQSTNAGVAVEQLSGAAAAPTIVVLLNTGVPVTSPAGIRATKEIAGLVARQRGVSQAVSYPQLSPLLRLTSPLAAKLFLSRDRHWSLIAATLSRGISGTHRTAAVVNELRRKLNARNVLLGGSAVTGAELGAQLRHDIESIEVWCLPLLLVLLLLVFSRPLAAGMPLLVGAMAAAEALAVLHLLVLGGVHVSLFALTTITGLSLGLGIDYSLLILSRFREQAASGQAVDLAVAGTFRTAGRTVLFSGLTIALSLAALTIFPVGFLFSVGLGGSLAALAATVTALVILPSVIKLAPQALIRAGTDRARPKGHATWRRVSTTVTKRPAGVAAVALAALLLLGAPAVSARLRAETANDLTPTGSSAQTARVLMQKFDPAAYDEIVTVLAHGGGEASMTRFGQRLRRLPGVSALGPVKQLARGLWVVNLLSDGARLSSTSQSLVKRLRAIARPRLEVTGPSARFLDQQSAVRSRLPITVLVVAFCTFLLLLMMTGSVVIPIKTLLMNALSFVAAFGVMVLIFQDGFLSGLLGTPPHGSVEVLQLVLIFSCVFALSTDYNVFVISRIQEEHRAGGSNHDPIASGLQRSGPVVSSAALLFCVTIGAFATSGIWLLKELSVGMVLAVAIDATLVRALLLPAVMSLLGDYNWWAPQALGTRIAALGLSYTATSGNPTPRSPSRPRSTPIDSART